MVYSGLSMVSAFIRRSLERFFIASIALIMACTLLQPTYLAGEGFVEGTLVGTPSGYVPIDELSAGDSVVSYNMQTGALEYDVVSRIEQKTIDSFVLITLGETLLAVAPEHRLYCPFEEDAWVMARAITKQHQIAMVPPQVVAVDGIETIKHPVKTYSLSVQKNHNFFVSKQGILVHNMDQAVLKTGVDFLRKILEVVAPPVAAAVIHKATSKNNPGEIRLPPPPQASPPAVEVQTNSNNAYVAESIKIVLDRSDTNGKELILEPDQSQYMLEEGSNVGKIYSGGEWRPVILGPDHSLYQQIEKADKVIDYSELQHEKEVQPEQKSDQPSYTKKNLLFI